MTPMLNVMCDIETLSVAPNAAVIAIGAVEFNPRKPYELGQEFYALIDWEDAMKHGKVDAGTLAWWFAQDISAKQALLRQSEQRTLRFTLSLFRGFLRDCGVEEKEFKFWVHGENFDEPVLHNAFLAVGYERPWKYNCVRDTRTLYEVTGVWPVTTHYPQLTAHNALCDAKRQAYDVQRAFLYNGVWHPDTEMPDARFPDLAAGAMPV